MACVMIRETTPNGGEVVELFQSTIGKAEKEPWCMSFVQSLVAFTEWAFHVTSGLAPSEHCLTVWNASKSIVVSNPRAGDLIIYRHVGTTQGHVEIIVDVITDKGIQVFHTVAGNTSNGTGVNREGDGVYSKIRPNRTIGDMEIVGFLRPFQWV